MLEAYLTIDDSPSAYSGALTDFLAGRDIQGLLYCRGDRMEAFPDAMVHAVQKGQVIANHSYSHRPFGDLTLMQAVEEIEKTESLIDACYKQAGIARPGKYFRFPYLDKGDGDRLERRFGEITKDPESFTGSDDEKVTALQDYLKREGFTQPFKNIAHPLYRNDTIAGDADCMITYSANDWMLTKRHLGQWNYKSVQDLKDKIDDDPYLCRGDGVQIVLFHDDPEIAEPVEALIGYMLEKGFVFRKIA